MARNPKQWRAYRQLVNEGLRDDNAGLNRFAARFSMARQLVDVRFTDLKADSAAGYTEGLRVALAYSALETLEKAISGQVGGTAIGSHELGERFRNRQCTRLRLLLIGNLEGATLITRLEDLTADPRADDVRPVAQGLRHLVFHGAFTPHGFGVAQSNYIRKFTADLAVAVLAQTEDRFASWVVAGGNSSS